MRHHLLCLAGSLAASALLVPPALAQTDTTQFNVQITISAECQINSATDLNFGSSGVIDTAVAASSAIAVQCTNGTDYDIGLDTGQGTGATVADRLMTGPNSETVTYSLYTDTGHTDVWGDTIGTDTVAGTGTGAEQTYSVYGQVPTQDTPTAGTYADVITVTLTY
ncbi:spore coat protein U [Mesorhizobium tianshanense]|uniref:Spore coat protein U-like protein n=1 Tax=Mesorhizobium tianshanense TaxID=39844 RepID=A0A562NSX9_9HYPH|nr:spore coat U domain-containing protein [Mesorhizobium tianshanense]TWI35312.1 spore coat protein U-like protein [Mesorhizobium tianshanense]GLS39217.1 spore coat protein U [Mesorhizobium tianshanense]